MKKFCLLVKEDFEHLKVIEVENAEYVQDFLAKIWANDWESLGKVVDTVRDVYDYMDKAYKGEVHTAEYVFLLDGEHLSWLLDDCELSITDCVSPI